MKKIQLFLELLGRLTHAEHFDTIEAVVAYIDPKVSSIPNFTAVWKDFKDAFRVEDEFFKQSQKQPGTAQIVAADKKRDESFIILKRTVEYHAISKVDINVAAAKLLISVIENYKHANAESYTKDSALITNCLEDLHKDFCQPAIATLGIADLIATLETDNNIFKELYRTRSKEVYKTAGEKLDLMRRETDLQFEVTVDCLNALYVGAYLASPTGDAALLLEDIIDTVNSYLATAERNLKRHAPSYRKNNKKPDKPEPKPEPKPYPDDIMHLTLTEQTINDPYDDDMNTANTMQLYFEGDENYAQKISPIINQCSIFLRDKNNVVYEFKKSSTIFTPEREPLGFGISDLQGDPIFKYPFEHSPTPYPGEIRKDDKPIALFFNVLFPKLVADNEAEDPEARKEEAKKAAKKVKTKKVKKE